MLRIFPARRWKSILRNQPFVWFSEAVRVFRTWVVKSLPTRCEPLSQELRPFGSLCRAASVYLPPIHDAGVFDRHFSERVDVERLVRLVARQNALRAARSSSLTAAWGIVHVAACQRLHVVLRGQDAAGRRP